MANIRNIGKAAGRIFSKGIIKGTVGGSAIAARAIFSGARAGARNFTAMPKTMENMPLKVGLGLGAAGVGFASAVGPATKEAALDVALGSPDADVSFTGRDLDARFIAGSAMGGAFGGLLAGSSGDIIGTGAYEGTGGAVSKASMAGGILGTAVGIGAAVAGNRKFGSKAMFAGKKGMARKAVAMSSTAMAGGIIGGSLPMVGAYGSTKAAERQSGDEWMNESVFSERARNSSASISALTRASGDIVFGMHNTRGGM